MPDEPVETADEALVAGIDDVLSNVARVLTGTTALVLGGAGSVAVFATDNEIGSAAMLVASTFCLVVAVGGRLPTKWAVGGQEVSWERAAVKKLVERAPLDVQAEIYESVDPAHRGSPTVESMIDRFVRHNSGSTTARQVHDHLVAAGWRPSTPLRSTYVLWRRDSSSGALSLYQNSRALVASAQPMRTLAARVGGGRVNNRGDVEFVYEPDPRMALAAADAFANSPADA